MATPKKRKHRLADKIISGAELTLQVLTDEGVDTIFGYSGGAILPTYDAIFRWNEQHPQKIDLIVPANEQGAGFMAAGYARATGRVGVSLVTSGPAATNSVTPIRDCMADSVPMVLICGQVARPAIGTDAFQEAPVFGIMGACAKHVFLVEDPEELEETVRTAFHIARSGRPGPVVIDLPKDVQNWECVFKGAGLLPLHGYQKRVDTAKTARITRECASEFFALLKASKRPLIYAGGGVINSNASADLRKFMQKFEIPAVTTLMGIGALDTQDDLCLHMLGMHGTACANYAVEDCDFLISVGARFDDRVAGVPSLFAPDAKIGHIDIDAAEIGKVKDVDWSCVGDAGQVLRDLMQYGKTEKTSHKPWLQHCKKLKKVHKLDFNRQGDLIQPQEVLEHLNTLTEGDAIICTGVGQHQMFSALYLHYKHPRQWLTSGSMGTMGFGLPAAIGAQAAFPGKTVIDIDGDGSLRMNVGELETCTNYNIPVKVLLLNNHGDGMVVQWQSLYFEGRFSGTDKTMHKKDFVKAAEADGFEFSKRVTDRKDLKKALKAFLAFDGPAFLEVNVDKYAFVYPMVGPGLGYKDMLTGPYIKGREAPPQEEKLDTSDSF
jgi:acetolactate synthase I/II/III large subunit